MKADACLVAAKHCPIMSQTMAMVAHRCEVSGGAGQEWPTEVCEMWRFFSSSRILKLMGFMALHSDVLAVKQWDPCKQHDGVDRQHVLEMLQSMNE